MYFEISQKFISDIKHIDSLQSLAALFETVIKKLGCKYFVCASAADPANLPGATFVLTNYPGEWINHFVESNYHAIDPILQNATDQLMPFTWNNTEWRYGLRAEQINILNEAKECGLGHGYTVPIHTSNGFPSSCSVVFEEDHVRQEALYAIHLMTPYLYSTALKIRTQSDRPLENKQLTPRQKQCLELIALGKTDWEISVILNVTESNVHYHVKNIFKILKVVNRTQAVVQALFLREIQFINLQVSKPSPEGFILLNSKFQY